ncbi:MAG: GGDEF domain-containing protein [Vulcanimicrobiota bacterium]
MQDISTTEQTIVHLARLELFESLDHIQLRQLTSIGTVEHYEPDIVLFAEGDLGDKLFLIIEGSLEVTSKDRQQVFLLEKGEVLGEIGLLDGLPRTATVTTAEKCVLFALTRKQFGEFLALDPMLALNVMTVTNRKVRAALSREKELNASLQAAVAELERVNRELEGMMDTKTRQLHRASEGLGEVLERDLVTGAFNHRKFTLMLREHLSRPVAFSLILFDLDHFQAINDTHGRQTGDRVLMKLAEVADSRLSGAQHLARLQDERFAILLADCELKLARSLADSICDAVSKHHFPIRGCAPGYVTVSMGVVQYPSHGLEESEMMDNATAALEQAKMAGRNCAVAAEKP